MNLLEKLTNTMQETLEQGASLALHNQNQEIEHPPFLGNANQH